jgi:hypothetical protein
MFGPGVPHNRTIAATNSHQLWMDIAAYRCACAALAIAGRSNA